jgi:DNA-binding SARP family transcriptional activator/tetratricopeptide (TPR) repeat protein
MSANASLAVAHAQWPWRGVRRQERACATAMPECSRALVGGGFMAANESAGERTASHVQFLGVPRLHLPSGLSQALSANDAALLLLPLLDGTLTRQRLAALIWPAVSRDKALLSFRQRRHRLREAVGQEPLAEGHGDCLALRLHHDLLAPEQQWQHDPLALAGELLGSLSFEHADALDEILHRARERWRERRARALGARAAQLEQERRLEHALPYRQRLCDDDPLDEAAHGELMKLHYLRAEHAEVRSVFERLRSALAHALGQTPSAPTRALHERLIQAGDLAAHPAAQVLLLRPPRIVGRTSAWQALQRAKAQGVAAIVQGEPGMGKSRLLQDFVQGSAGAVIAALRPADRSTPYALLARVARMAADQAAPQVVPASLPEPTRAVLAAIVPEWGVSAPKLEAAALQRALADWLRMAGVHAVAIDDAQSADTESIAVLADWLHCAPPADTSRPWWLLAVRRFDMSTAMRAWLDSADTDALVNVDLGPLSVGDARELLSLLDLPGFDASVWAEPLHRHSGGNPLFLLETVRALSDDASLKAHVGHTLPVPARVSELLERRITQLEGGAAKLASVAAIAGDDLDAELAATVLDTHPLDLAPAWAALEQAQVLRGCAFTHDLLRDAALQSTPAVVAAAMHVRIAEHLAQRWHEAPERAARHWADAGRWREAGAAYTQAALRSRRQKRRDDEARWWKHAISALESLGADAAELFEARTQTIETTLLTLGPQAALALAETLLPQAQTGRQRLTVWSGQLKALTLAGHFAQAADFAPQVADLAYRVGDTRAAVHAQMLLAQAEGQIGEADRGLDRLAACANVVQSLGVEELDYEYLMAQAYLLRLCGRHHDTAAVLDRAVPLAEQMGDAQELLTVLSNRALTLYELGRSRACYADALRSQALHARLGDVTSVPAAVCTTHVGVAAASLGRYTEALAHYEPARATFAAAGGGGMWLRMADLAQATLYVQLGQFARAMMLLNSGDWQSAAPEHQLRRHLLLARMARWQGAPALAHINAARSACTALRPSLVATRAALVLVEASYHMPAAQACAKMQTTIDVAVRSEEAPILLLARSRLADCQLGVDVAAAHATALRCWADAAECHVHDSVSTVWHACLRVFRACGDSASAQAVMSVASTWLREVALPNTPEPFKASFLERNPAVRELRLWSE